MKKNKKREERKRRLLIALLLLLFTGGVLSVGTYAWFSANKTVTVSDITVEVAASNGLQISADGITFKTLLSTEDLVNASTTYATATNQIPSTTNKLVPVSTVGTLDASTGFIDMYKGEILTIVDPTNGETDVLTAEKSTETNGTSGDFIAFDLFFQVHQESTIYLTNNSKVLASGTSKGIEYASRIAFVYQGNVPSGSTASVIQAMKGTSTKYDVNDTKKDEATIRIWEPNNDVHTASGLSNAALYGEGVYGTGITPALTDSPQLKYYGVKSEIDLADEVPIASTSSTYFSEVTPYLSTGADGIPSSAYAELFTLKAGITKIRVYMWIEGQDVDCENNASGSALTYSLQFSVLDKAA